MNNELNEALNRLAYRFNIGYFFVSELNKTIEVVVNKNQVVTELTELIESILKQLHLTYKVKVTNG
jgi:hypothetical protein